MASQNLPAGPDNRAAFSALAAFSAGVLLGARPREASRTRMLATIGAAALAGLSLMRPSHEAVVQAGLRRRAGQVRFSLVIPRAVEQVFALFADFENFPRFIGSLTSVTDYGDGRSRWRGVSPGGRTIEWSTVTTKFVTNSVIGFRSVPGADIDMTGVLRFTPDGTGTCVRVALDYQAKSSTLRDSIAALLMPRNSKRIEQEMRTLSEQMEQAPHAMTRELPPVMHTDREPQP